MWNPEQLLEDFLAVAKFAGIELQREAIQIETLPMPHRPPRSLPTGKTAVYLLGPQRDRWTGLTAEEREELWRLNSENKQIRMRH